MVIFLDFGVWMIFFKVLVVNLVVIGFFNNCEYVSKCVNVFFNLWILDWIWFVI